MTRHRLAALAATVMLAVAACGAPDSGLLPPPSSTSSTSPEPVTEPVDLSAIRLEPLPGVTTTTTPIEAGRSTIRGRVLGPDGGASGAIVRIERLVGDAVQRRDIPTGPGGEYIVANVPGGRYRVRAFLAPQLAMMQPEIFFLRDGDERAIDLRTERFEGLAVQGSTTPASPIVGQGVNIAVRVAERAVDADGIGREVPRPGVAVQLRVTGLEPIDQNPGRGPDPDDDDDDEPADESGDESGPTARVTDGDGVVVFQFTCERVGETTATAIVGSGDDEQIFPLEIPPCSPVPTTTTAPPASSDPDATTTTEP